ncbi:MAG: SRPBCC family protein [Pseudomonadales bacterium]|jgi:uncharacterized protein YndB with AHSA1/START domain|nr:SRPBCC family protein [Pseudomonadales bacterium]MDP6469613.1 SRPBCC family protein [Pseudomonadales bacterium]MDP6827454.1 SRPBCC family protein [Pseudomonadales bacterium]MDP6972184.1 SRPBCC family protein [Pseudomonadales bacterium]|tara:strand:- start:458 stop:988 length:531 start_codon:yes stop_codon:yes gene_type:complete
MVHAINIRRPTTLTTSDDLGSIEKRGDEYEAVLERTLDHNLPAVWVMLTEPDKMEEWLASGEIKLSKGGGAKLNFVDSGIVIDSTVTEFDPPHVLEYSWSSCGEPLRPVRWELEATEDGSRLRLTLRNPADEDVARSCAGWEAHLMVLLAAIESVPIKFPFEHFMETREAYNELMA